MNIQEKTKTFENVPKRQAFKTHDYDNVGLKIWVDVASVRENFIYLSSRILQAVFTQPAKDSPSFLACSSIWFSKSSSKRSVFIELLGRSYFKFFVFLSCIGNIQNVYFFKLVISNIIQIVLDKTIAQRVRTSMSYLTQPLNEVMIMANRYDNAHLCARQSKLYKFYDLSTAQVVQTTATTERQARKNLGKQSLIFIARKPISPVFERSTSWGGCSHV